MNYFRSSYNAFPFNQYNSLWRFSILNQKRFNVRYFYLFREHCPSCAIQEILCLHIDHEEMMVK
jgi:hypothetical protein